MEDCLEIRHPGGGHNGTTHGLFGQGQWSVVRTVVDYDTKDPVCSSLSLREKRINMSA